MLQALTEKKYYRVQEIDLKCWPLTRIHQNGDKNNNIAILGQTKLNKYIIYPRNVIKKVKITNSDMGNDIQKVASGTGVYK